MCQSAGDTGRARQVAAPQSVQRHPGRWCPERRRPGGVRSA